MFFRPHPIETRVLRNLTYAREPHTLTNDPFWETLPNHWQLQGIDSATALIPPNMFGDVSVTHFLSFFFYFQKKNYEWAKRISTQRKVMSDFPGKIVRISPVTLFRFWQKNVFFIFSNFLKKFRNVFQRIQH